MARSRRQAQLEIEQIAKLITAFKTDQEIIRDLEIPERTFYRYKRKLIAISADRFKTQKLEDVALHKEVLNDRLTYFLGLLNTKILRSLEARETPTKDLTGLFNCARDISISLFQLNTQGIQAVNNMKSITEHIINDGSNEVRDTIEIGLLSKFNDQDKINK